MTVTRFKKHNKRKVSRKCNINNVKSKSRAKILTIRKNSKTIKKGGVG